LSVFRVLGSSGGSKVKGNHEKVIPFTTIKPRARLVVYQLGGRKGRKLKEKNGGLNNKEIRR